MPGLVLMPGNRIRPNLRLKACHEQSQQVRSRLCRCLLVHGSHTNQLCCAVLHHCETSSLVLQCCRLTRLRRRLGLCLCL